PHLSLVAAVDFSQEARWLFMTDSVSDLLGFEPGELIGQPSLDLVHPDEFPRVRQIHYDTIQQDKAAVLVYLRMRHKDPFRGYVLCGVVGKKNRTVVHNVLVGSVSFANPAKALHNASTAQEIEVITPSAAANFEFRRWHDPSPMPPSPIPREMASIPMSPSSERSSHSPDERDGLARAERRNSIQSSSSSYYTSDHEHDRDHSERQRTVEVITFDRLSNKSFRTAFILNRFSSECHILYCSNDLLIQAQDAIGHSFYDFVDRRDERIVRDWIDLVKSWGVNEKGQPSDGGFGFGKFCLLTERRESSPRMPEPTPSRNRHGSTSRGSGGGGGGGHRAGRYAHGNTHYNASSRPSPTVPRTQRPSHSPTRDIEKFMVDAIFSAHSDGLMVILRRA
ncbi:hypothetical protein CPB84DRAFT_1685300, partial [Gymnopilus junonius]